MTDPIEENRPAYLAAKQQLEAEHMGRTALLHKGEVVGIYNDTGDAYKVGCDNYGLGKFMLQVIGQKPISLGIHTLCVPTPGTVGTAAAAGA